MSIEYRVVWWHEVTHYHGIASKRSQTHWTGWKKPLKFGDVMEGEYQESDMEDDEVIVDGVTYPMYIFDDLLLKIPEPGDMIRFNSCPPALHDPHSELKNLRLWDDYNVIATPLFDWEVLKNKNFQPVYLVVDTWDGWLKLQNGMWVSCCQGHPIVKEEQ